MFRIGVQIIFNKNGCSPPGRYLFRPRRLVKERLPRREEGADKVREGEFYDKV